MRHGTLPLPYTHINSAVARLLYLFVPAAQFISKRLKDKMVASQPHSFSWYARGHINRHTTYVICRMMSNFQLKESSASSMRFPGPLVPGCNFRAGYSPRNVFVGETPDILPLPPAPLLAFVCQPNSLLKN